VQAIRSIRVRKVQTSSEGSLWGLSRLAHRGRGPARYESTLDDRQEETLERQTP